MSALISLAGIDRAIAALALKPDTLKARLVTAIRRHFAEPDDLQRLTAIDTEELVRQVYQVSKAAEVKAKRKNLSSLKSALNKSLRELAEDDNPQSLVIGKENVFAVSEERRDSLLREMELAGAASPERLREVFDTFKQLFRRIVSEKGIDEIQDIVQELNETRLLGGGIPDLPDQEAGQTATGPEGSGMGDDGDDGEIEEIDQGELEQLVEIDEQELPGQEQEEAELLEVDDNAQVEEIDQEELEQLAEIDEQELPGRGQEEAELLEVKDDAEIEEIEQEELEQLTEIDERDLPGQEREEAELLEVEDDVQVEEIDQDELEQLAEIDEQDLPGREQEEAELLEVEDNAEVEEIDQDELEQLAEIDEQMLEQLGQLGAGGLAELAQAGAGATALQSEPAEPAKPAELVIERSALPFCAIPAGIYQVGGDRLAGAPGNHAPRRQVELAEFRLAATPVTNELFELFVRRTGYRTRAEKAGYGLVYEGRLVATVDPVSGRETITINPGTTSRQEPGACWRQPRGPGSDLSGKARHPVVQVAYEDALAFAAWAGKTLPSEEQWEAAARGPDGRPFPWGNEWRNNSGNFESSCRGDTSPVEHYAALAASPFGVLDLLGNIYEWTATSHQPAGKAANAMVLKGGCWCSRGIITIGHREIERAATWSNLIGFRLLD